METLLKDIRYGLRNLLKRPGSTAIAVITLALGIGANAAIFSFVNGLLLRPLAGVERPDRLVGIYTSDYSSGLYGTSSYPDYLDFRRQADAFADLAAYERAVLNLAGSDGSERLRGASVTSNYFDVLGVGTRVGRTLRSEDDPHQDTNPGVVISHALWQRRFGADQGVVGQPITLNNRVYTIIGVTAESFRGLRIGDQPELFLPLTEESKAEARGNRGLSITGRLRDGVTIEQAQAQISAIADRLARAYPETNMGTLVQPDAPRPMSVVAETRINPKAQGGVRLVTSLLLVVVGLVLLIACANVANLLLAWASSRRREIAIRLALGASRGRLIRQLLTESILLALFGGAAGLCVGLWTADLIPGFFPPGEASGMDLSLDWRVLGFTTVITLVTGVLFGLAPALRASRPDLVSSLKDEKGHTRRVMRFGLRNILVTAQIAMSVLLLIGAGLFLRSLQSAVKFDPGFETQHLLLASLGTGGTKMNRAQQQGFYQQLVERIGSQPGVRAVSLTTVVPLSGGGQRRNVLIEGYQPRPNEDTELNTNVVGLNYFDTIGIPVVQGRDFGAQDRAGSPGVVVVNEELAQRYFPGQNAVGKRLRTDSEGPHLEIIGVVRTAKYRNLRETPLPFIYIPLAQEMQENMTLLVRSTNEPSGLLPAVRSELQQLDKNVPVYAVKTMTEQIDAALSADRMTAVLLSIFGGAALLLAAVGLYGVMSYSVSRRTHEIGVRMALGAQTVDVLRMVVKNGMTLSLVGLAIGLAAAFAFTRVMATLLFEITPTDAGTYATVSVGLLLVALLACYIPARRATKVDPLVALRYE
ncbi:MAG: ABC transporter permease [Acidobacteriota bacterium]